MITKKRSIIKHAWESSDEIAYIDKIGSFTEYKFNKKAVLTGYIKALKNRKVWDFINENLIISYAQLKLNDLEFSELKKR